MTRNPFIRSACLVAAAMLLAVPHALAQTQTDAPAAEFEGMVEVSEVLLDVLVTDKQGNVVVGLGPDDFVVTEDGEEVPVDAVSFYSNRYEVRDGAEAAGERRLSGPAENEILADRHFIFFFHDQQLNSGPIGNRLVRQQLDAARQAKRWIAEEMLGGDWVAVVSYDVKLHVHTDFTRERGQLIEAIDRAARSEDTSNEWASRRPDGEDLEGRPSLLAHLPEGKELRKETKRIYGAFELLGEATRDILGRKNLMLFSAGFGDLERVAGFGPNSVTARPDQRYWPDMVQSLNDNNVAIYTIDLTPSNFDHPQADFMSQLASTTGGRYYENFVNFITPMRQIADEANGYYLLSFPASHPADESGYRKVQVATRNPQFDVRARQGYRYGV